MDEATKSLRKKIYKKIQCPYLIQGKVKKSKGMDGNKQ
jgi:hypothetical protein